MVPHVIHDILRIIRRIVLIYSAVFESTPGGELDVEHMTKRSHDRIRKMTSAAVFAALLCVVSPWSVPIGAVPVSLATFAVYLAGLTLGRSAVMSVVCYVLLGCVGMPVFSGFSGGVGVIAGPTGGFLTGYIPAVLVCGSIADVAAKTVSKVGRFLGYLGSAVAAAVIVHACGVVWYMSLTGQSFAEAAVVCVMPFVLTECVKLLAAAVAAQVLRERVVWTK